MRPAAGRLSIDHVLMPVADLEAAASHLLAEHGLASLPGGWHPGVGTANRIVPLGSTYLELIAAVDPAEAAAGPRGARVMRAAAEGLTFLTWAARADDLEAERRRAVELGLGVGEIISGSRRRPDGTVLRWRSLDLFPSPGADDPGLLPFLIEWGPDPLDHPGAMRVKHPAGAGDVAALRFQDPEPDAARTRLSGLVGDGVESTIGSGPASGLTATELLGPEGGRLVLS